LEAEVVMDTTAQEKAITHPTDTKLHAKIINQAVKMAKQAGVKLRQSYRRTVPKLLQAQRGWRQAKGRKRAGKAARKLRTIASRLVRELERKLEEGRRRQWGATQSDVTAEIVLVLVLFLFPLYSLSFSFSPPIPDERERERERVRERERFRR
jgi:hypothetical protein